MRMILIAAIAAAGCGKGSGGPTSGFKPDLTRKAIQGAWTMRWDTTTGSGGKVAVQIDGDKVMRWDGKVETPYELVIEDPCQIGFKEPGAQGATYNFGYVIKDGKPVFGVGDAGMRTGKTAVICAGVSTYALDAHGGCQERMGGMGRWKSAKCGIRKDGDHEVFFWTFVDKESTTPMDGDLVWDELRDDHAERATDYAAAKAAIAAPPAAPP